MSDRKIYRLRVRTCSGEYEGTFFSPTPDRRLSDTVARLEGYLNLKDALVVETGERHPFMMIGKGSIETIILLEELAGEGR